MTKKELRDIMNEYDDGYYNIDKYNYVVVDKETKEIVENCIDLNTAMDFINNEIMYYNTTDKDYIIYNLNDYKDNDILDINGVELW